MRTNRGRWRSRRAETGLAAAVARRHAAAAAWDNKRKAPWGTLAALLRLRRSHASEATDRQSRHQLPSAPGPRDAARGAVDRASRPRGPAVRNPSGDICGPIVHQDPPPVEQVAAPVGGLDTVAVDVGKRELAHLARRVGALGGPIPKARTKPVRDGVDAEVVQQVGQGGVVQHPPARWVRGTRARLRRRVPPRRRAPRVLRARAAPDAPCRPSCARPESSTPSRRGRPAPTGRCAPRPSTRR